MHRHATDQPPTPNLALTRPEQRLTSDQPPDTPHAPDAPDAPDAEPELSSREIELLRLNDVADRIDHQTALWLVHFGLHYSGDFTAIPNFTTAPHIPRPLISHDLARLGHHMRRVELLTFGVVRSRVLEKL
jgi:hypothetical protein